MTEALTDFACPRCGERHDRATATSVESGAEIRPQDGDIGLCIACAAPLQYRAGLTATWMTYQEVKALPPRERDRLMVAMVAILTLRWPPEKGGPC